MCDKQSGLMFNQRFDNFNVLLTCLFLREQGSEPKMSSISAEAEVKRERQTIASVFAGITTQYYWHCTAHSE